MEKIHREKVVAILEQQGMKVEEAKSVLEFLQMIADLAVEQYLKSNIENAERNRSLSSMHCNKAGKKDNKLMCIKN